MILGFMRRRSSQPKPMRSNDPGPKFSMRTSARSTIFLRIARPSGALRSSVIAFLLLFSIKKNQASSSVFSDTMRRPGSPPGGSILMTSAPSQPSIWAQLGPASYCVRSNTTVPSSALAMSALPISYVALRNAPARPARPSIVLSDDPLNADRAQRGRCLESSSPHHVDSNDNGLAHQPRGAAVHHHTQSVLRTAVRRPSDRVYRP